LEKGNGTIDGVVIKKKEQKVIIEEKEIDFLDFLVNKGETAFLKYGDVLKKVVALTD